MSNIRDSLDLVGHARLERSLRDGAAAELTGTLRVSGRPGGVVHMRRGLVVSVVSPGAPGVQALLVRTGRIRDEDWARTGGTVEWAAGVVGAAHLNVLQAMATQDALFAMLVGSIDGCWFEEGQATPEGDGTAASELLPAVFRKLAALAALDRAILPYRERLAPARALPARSDAHDGVAAQVTPAAPAQADSIREGVMRYADGRRTARDIAFLCGRSLYAVTVEMSRMLGEGILRESQAPHPAPPRAAPPRPAPLRPASPDPVPLRASSPGPAPSRAVPPHPVPPHPVPPHPAPPRAASPDLAPSRAVPPHPASPDPAPPHPVPLRASSPGPAPSRAVPPHPASPGPAPSRAVPPHPASPDLAPSRAASHHPVPASAQPPDNEQSPVRPGLPSSQPAAAEVARNPAEQKAVAFWRDILRLGGRAGERRT